MKIIICAGKNTANITSVLERRFRTGNLEFRSIIDIAAIKGIFQRGEYFDRAIVIDKSWTNDDTDIEELSVRERLAEFVKVFREKCSEDTTLVFLSADKEQAKIAAEESVGIPNRSRVVFKPLPYHAKFISDLATLGIDELPEEIIYSLFDSSSVIKNDTQYGGVLTAVTELDTDDLLNTDIAEEEGIEDSLTTYDEVPTDSEMGDKTEHTEDLDEGWVTDLLSKEEETGEEIEGDTEDIGDEIDFDNVEELDTGSDSDDEIDDLADTDEIDGVEELEDTDEIDGIDYIEELGDEDELDGLDDIEELGDIDEIGEMDEMDIAIEEDDISEIDEGADIEIDELSELEEDIDIIGSESEAELIEDEGEESSLHSQSDLDRAAEEDRTFSVIADVVSDTVGVQIKEAEKKIELDPSMFEVGEKPIETDAEKTQITKGKKGIAHRNSPKLKVEDVKKLFLANTGRAITIVVTGTSGSGKTTTAFNVAKTLNKMDYSVLIIDLDTLTRGQAIISKKSFEAVHNPDTASTHIKTAVSSGTNIGKNVGIISPGLYVLSTGLAADKIEARDLGDTSKLDRFFNSVRSYYDFVVVDMSLDTASDYASNVLFSAEHIILTMRLSNWSTYKTMLEMANIEKEEVQQLMFERSNILITSTDNTQQIMGKKLRSIAHVLRIMDEEIRELIGVDPEHYFAEMAICGAIQFNPLIDTLWKTDSRVANSDEYEANMLKIIYSVVTGRAA